MHISILAASRKTASDPPLAPPRFFGPIDSVAKTVSEMKDKGGYGGPIKGNAGGPSGMVSRLVVCSFLNYQTIKPIK